MGLSRRDFIGGVAVGTILAVPIGRAVAGRPRGVNRVATSRLPAVFATPFVVPPIAKPVSTANGVDRYRITMAPMTAEIIPGQLTPLFGYNGSFPGPTIRATRGRQITARFVNKLPAVHPDWVYEPTTSTHLHGGASQPQYDGYASDLTRPGQYKDYIWSNNQTGRTLWYHDHAEHHTAQNAYMGLSGQYHIIDPAEATLGLPSGEFDVPLTIRDALFQADGKLLFSLDDTDGIWGDVILVNGRPWPVMKVKRRLYRFRILNSSLSRSYRLALDNGAPFTVIGSDAGLMAAPVTTTELIVGMSERYDVVIDFSTLRAGARVVLKNLPLDYNDDYPTTDRVMAFDVTADAFPTTNNRVPAVLAPRSPALVHTPAESVATRTYEAQRSGGEWTINGITWHHVVASNFTLVDGTPRLNTVETWKLSNPHGGWTHPFHIHGVDFVILSRNGMPPRPYEAGPKDTTHVGANETVTVLLCFELAGKYMIHCHNLMHEDHDMMSQYEVIGGTVPAPSPFSAPARNLPEAPLL